MTTVSDWGVKTTGTEVAEKFSESIKGRNGMYNMQAVAHLMANQMQWSSLEYRQNP